MWGQWILKPLLAISTAGAVALLLGRFLPLTNIPMLVWLIVGVACLCVVYGILLPLLGCITREDLHRTVSR